MHFQVPSVPSKLTLAQSKTFSTVLTEMIMAGKGNKKTNDKGNVKTSSSGSPSGTATTATKPPKGKGKGSKGK